MGCQPTKEVKRRGASKRYLLQTIRDHKGGINCMVLSDDGSLLVTGSDDRTARMWSTLSNPSECLGVLQGHEGYITCCAIHEQCVITGSSDATLRKWLIATGDCVAVYVGHEARVSRVISVGHFLFSTSSDRTVRAWLFDLSDVSDEQGESCIKIFQGHTKGTYPIIHVATDEDAGLDLGAGILVTGSADCTARSWSVDSGLCLKVKHYKKSAVMTWCVWRNGGAVKFSNALRSSWREFAIMRLLPEQLQMSKGSGNIPPLRKDSTLLSYRSTWHLDVTSGVHYTMQAILCTVVFPQHQKEEQQIFRGHTAPLNCLVMDSTNEILYTSGGDGVIRSWNLMSGESLREMRGHEGPVFCLLIHKRMLFSGSSDKTARAWVLEFGECTRIYRGHRHTVSSIRHFDGMLYTGSGDAVARMFEAKSGSLKRTFRGHENAVVSVEVVPGKLFTASYDGSIKVWNTTGVKDETVFGTELSENRDPREEEMEEDSEDVQKAVKSLDPYLQY